jgi:hypothetical protein
LVVYHCVLLRSLGYQGARAMPPNQISPSEVTQIMAITITMPRTKIVNFIHQDIPPEARARDEEIKSFQRYLRFWLFFS